MNYKLHKSVILDSTINREKKYLGKLSDNTKLSLVFKGVEHFNYILMLQLPQYLKAYKQL